MRNLWSVACALLFLITTTAQAQKANRPQFWMKIKAKDKVERSAIANTGANIETITDDYVIAFGSAAQVEHFKKAGTLDVSFEWTTKMLDFPKSDSNFHNFAELQTKMQEMKAAHPDLVAIEEIGKSLEGRSIFNMRISTDLKNSSAKPGIVFMGTHHAREHVSTEIPLMLAEYLLTEYTKGNPRIKRLVEGREINIIPLVNPDGSEYDISTGDYQMWRKNRARDSSGNVYGVDLNRNYGYGWGGGGASTDPDDETYRGPSAFSEPETQTIKKFVDERKNLSVLLTYHTFSELILYPWGGTYDPISDERDHSVFDKMAKTMAQWNKYTPEQSSDLYIASGDTCDWAYGEHKIFAFTFELDPTNMWEGGFYPGQAVIPTVFQKNLEPALYLIEYADNPYRVLEPSQSLGFQTNLLN